MEKNYMSKLSVIAKIIAKKESVENVKSELLKMIEPTRKEEGCIEYSLHQDNDNPAIFVFYETWDSDLCLEKHMNTDHFKKFVTAIAGITEGVEINKLTKL